MKLKYTFVINEVAGQKIAVPIDCGYGKQSIIKTNDTGVFILELLKEEISKEEILSKIAEEYTVESMEDTSAWVDSFIEKLKTADVLCYE